MTNCTKEAQNDVVKTHNDVIDTISREDAINVIRKNHYRLQGKGMTEEVLVADLEALPSAEKTGAWEEHVFDGMMGSRPRAWMCNQCNGINIVKTDYCPCCGSYNGGTNENMG